MHHEELKDEKYTYIDESHKDIKGNWVSASRWLWAMSIATFLAFAFAGCYNLYKHRYMGKPEVAVPENTQYHPKYK